MKINFLGDSITEGGYASTEDKRYSSLVCKAFAAIENNYGVWSTRIAKQRNRTRDIDDKDFISRAPMMDKDADFVFIFGGTNDYGHGDASLGNMEDISQYTFYGALKYLVEYLISIYGKEKLCFILPLHRFAENNPYGKNNMKSVKGAPLSAYVQAEREIFSFYDVDYLETQNLIPEPQEKTGDEWTTDGLHLTDKGHKLLADKLIEYLCAKEKNGNIVCVQ